MGPAGVLVKCRFCDAAVPLKRDKSVNWAWLKSHVSKDHEAESRAISSRIAESGPREPENLAGYAVSRGPAAISREFRRRMGYSPTAQGAEQRKDDKD